MEFLKSHKKLCIAIGIAVVALILWLCVFHLFGSDKIAYDLFISNVDDLYSPEEARIVSGCSDCSDTDDEDFAFVAIRSENAYGASMVDYYCIMEEYGFSSVDVPLQIDLCKSNELSVWKINLRIALYWMFR